MSSNRSVDKFQRGGAKHGDGLYQYHAVPNLQDDNDLFIVEDNKDDADNDDYHVDESVPLTAPAHSSVRNASLHHEQQYHPNANLPSQSDVEQLKSYASFQPESESAVTYSRDDEGSLANVDGCGVQLSSTGESRYRSGSDQQDLKQDCAIEYRNSVDPHVISGHNGLSASVLSDGATHRGQPLYNASGLTVTPLTERPIDGVKESGHAKLKHSPVLDLEKYSIRKHNGFNVTDQVLKNGQDDVIPLKADTEATYLPTSDHENNEKHKEIDESYHASLNATANPTVKNQNIASNSLPGHSNIGNAISNERLSLTLGDFTNNGIPEESLHSISPGVPSGVSDQLPLIDPSVEKSSTGRESLNSGHFSIGNHLHKNPKHAPTTKMGDLDALQKYGPKSDSTVNGVDNKVDININGVGGDHFDYQKSEFEDDDMNHSNHKVTGAVHEAKIEDVILDDSGPCGWGKFQFECCQKFRDPRWFLVILTLCGACQGMAVNGYVNTVISTVERRFEISSTESGLIASCYDIMFVLLVIPVSYFGGQGHKPRYLGIGIFILGVGSFVFSLPHFISDTYHVENALETVCRLNSTVTSRCESGGSSSLSNYKYFFFLGQLLHGAGATPLYTLGVTFMDENVPQRSSSFYNGIFYTGAIIGPAVGYMVGSEFLDIYTDIGVDPVSLGLDSNNPKWVGAWWIGFLLSGTFGVLLSLPLLAYPKSLPGSSKYIAERGKETQASKQVDETGKNRGLRDILLSIKLLLTNIPFMFVNLAAAADGILIAGFSTFMPKFIEYQFGIAAGTAALYVGLAIVPAGGGATFAGGAIVRCFNLKVRGILRLCTIASFVLCVLALGLLMQCDTTPFAGVTLSYGQTNVDAATFLGKNLDNSCNSNCSCYEEDYFPICGRDKVMYFSPCYAGCTDVFLDGDVKRYANCSCINYNMTADDIASGATYEGEFGKCELTCKWLTLFIVCFGVMVVFVFISSMPSLTATLRCVPDHQRSFGLGIQWIVARCLGSIPGPILFGKMFDLACLVWQKRCDGDGSCFFYDNNKMSVNLLVLSLVFAAAAAVSFLMALCFYRVKEVEDEVALELDVPSRQSSVNPTTSRQSSQNAPNAKSKEEDSHVSTNVTQNNSILKDDAAHINQSFSGTKL